MKTRCIDKPFLLLTLVLTLMLGSCGLFKKKCDCPKFGNAPAAKHQQG